MVYYTDYRIYFYICITLWVFFEWGNFDIKTNDIQGVSTEHISCGGGEIFFDLIEYNNGQ